MPPLFLSYISIKTKWQLFHWSLYLTLHKSLKVKYITTILNFIFKGKPKNPNPTSNWNCEQTLVSLPFKRNALKSCIFYLLIPTHTIINMYLYIHIYGFLDVVFVRTLIDAYQSQYNLKNSKVYVGFACLHSLQHCCSEMSHYWHMDNGIIAEIERCSVSFSLSLSQQIYFPWLIDKSQYLRYSGVVRHAKKDKYFRILSAVQAYAKLD